MPTIDLNNWNYCHYETSRLRAFISQGGIPGTREDEVQQIYFLTVSDPDFKEIYQEEFFQLQEAVTILNSRYKHWKFIDRAVQEGCSSCQAH